MKSCLTVLIVDDTALMRVILRRTLEAAGLEIVGEAVDGMDAIEQGASGFISKPCSGPKLLKAIRDIFA